MPDHTLRHQTEHQSLATLLTRSATALFATQNLLPAIAEIENFSVLLNRHFETLDVDMDKAFQDT